MVGGKITRSTSSSTSETVDDATEKLITRVCHSFSSQLEAKFNLRFDQIDNKLSEVNDTLNQLKKENISNSKAICKLQEKTDYTEQLMKKNSLRIHGVIEEMNEDVVEVVTNFINRKLRVPLTPTDIDSAFRIGKDGQEQPRIILISFVRNIKRNEVFKAKKILKDTDYSIFEDLTKQRYDILLTGKKKFGRNKVWSSGGRIYAWNDRDNKKILLDSVEGL